MVGDGVFDLVAALDDGERVGVGGLGEVALALLAAAEGAVDVGGDLGEGVGDVAALVVAALDAAEAPAQGVAVAEHDLVELIVEGMEVEVEHPGRKTKRSGQTRMFAPPV
jgi:hypothetical protein